MSFWNHNVELMDEIIESNLPEPWHTQLMEGKIDILDVPEDIRDKAFADGEGDYWGGQIDHAVLQMEEALLEEALTIGDNTPPGCGGI